jgi:hypothetical protein
VADVESDSHDGDYRSDRHPRPPRSCSPPPSRPRADDGDRWTPRLKRAAT